MKILGLLRTCARKKIITKQKIVHRRICQVELNRGGISEIILRNYILSRKISKKQNKIHFLLKADTIEPYFGYILYSCLSEREKSSAAKDYCMLLLRKVIFIKFFKIMFISIIVVYVFS